MAIWGIGDIGSTAPTRNVGTEADARNLASATANSTRCPMILYVSHTRTGSVDTWGEEDVIHPDPGTDTPTIHLPQLGSDVEAWLTRHRDAYNPEAAGWEKEAWEALNSLIADYRARAVGGTSLSDPAYQ